jgi:flavorubredoxin
MLAREIVPDVYSISAIDWDQRLFDALVPLPQGTSYNSYLIRGSEQTALIDTVPPDKTGGYLDVLKASGIRRLDYIVSNHAEQDHSGSIPAVLEQFPEARIVTNSKCRDFCIDALSISPDKFMVIRDGDTLSLGNKTLQFLLTPWVHWPDTMVSHLSQDRILFSCDFLGSHIASSDLYATNEAEVCDAAKRYYAQIMMPFRPNIRKHLERLAKLKIDYVAPSHGPVYSKPAFILDLYKKWASDETEKEVILLYVSMHESTAQMVQYLVDRLMEKGLSVKQYNVTGADTGELAKSLVDASTVVFASPTVLNGPHPSIASAACLINALKPKTKFASVIGSFGWGSKLSDQIREMLPNLKAHFLDPVLIKGCPKAEDFQALTRLAEEIRAANHPLARAAATV